MIKVALEDNQNVTSSTFRMQKLRRALPEFFDKNGSFKIDQFKDSLTNEEVDFSRESYKLDFVGKSYAEFQTGIKNETVLVPDVKHNSEIANKDSKNVYIVGDNLEALKHLRNSYRGKIKCIYIDPPYNTGEGDFIYNDSFGFSIDDLIEKVGLTEEEAERTVALNGKAGHSAWLTFMYPRLALANQLLSEDGVLFVSIDDNEMAGLKLILDDLFGENSLSRITWESKTKSQNTKSAKNRLQPRTESILVYKKQAEPKDFALEVKSAKEYPYSDERGVYRNYPVAEMSNTDVRARSTMVFDILGVSPREGKQWKLGKQAIQEFADRGDVELINNSPSIRMRPEDEDGNFYKPFWSHFFEKDIYGTAESAGSELKRLFGVSNMFDTVKPVRLIKALINHMRGKEEDTDFTVLDFFSGSATTADAVMQLNAEEGFNLKYIMVQLDDEVGGTKNAYREGYRTIDEIGRARIQKAAKKIQSDTQAEIDYGFKLFRLETPNVSTLESLDDFIPESSLFEVTKDYNTAMSSGDTPGEEIILTTLFNRYNKSLTPIVDYVKLDTYRLPMVGNDGFVVAEGFNQHDLRVLMELLENKKVKLNRLIVSVYAVSFSTLKALDSASKFTKSKVEFDVVEVR